MTVFFRNKRRYLFGAGELGAVWNPVLRVVKEETNAYRREARGPPDGEAASRLGHAINGVAKFSKAGIPDSVCLISLLRDNVDLLHDMDPVANVTGDEVPKDSKPVIGNSKIELFASVPSVISEGEQIISVKNWKGRGYDSYFFAAPVMYKGGKEYVGVIVLRDAQSNMYYLHEAVTENGEFILFDKKELRGISDRLQLKVEDTVKPLSSTSKVTQNKDEVKG